MQAYKWARLSQQHMTRLILARVSHLTQEISWEAEAQVSRQGGATMHVMILTNEITQHIATHVSASATASQLFAWLIFFHIACVSNILSTVAISSQLYDSDKHDGRSAMADG
jgi:hypothetical protein